MISLAQAEEVLNNLPGVKHFSGTITREELESITPGMWRRAMNSSVPDK
jgi:hypothetical protein